MAALGLSFPRPSLWLGLSAFGWLRLVFLLGSKDILTPTASFVRYGGEFVQVCVSQALLCHSNKYCPKS